ncbi:DUF4349 domain-containing protein [Lysobacter panacisoli]|uniref:DUF4349 domain-containing protein n=1 Tax=Lysobacter panacisoli TaxID=1255263 RepID=A0ABP9L4K0_9GAMM|nr:DUF4349 domain-containing protein [Lysobacter panacisoli]
MRTTLHAGLLACALMAVLGGCSRQKMADEAAADAASPAMETAAGAAAPPAEAPSAAAPSPDVQAQLQSSATTQEQGERRFIRTASAEFRVRDVYRSTLAIEDLVARQGGFVANNRVQAHVDDIQLRPSGDGKLVELATYTVRGNLQVRVPSERTQAFLRELAAQVEFLDSRQFDAVDAQFDLLRQRLAYARHQDAQHALGDAAAQRGKAGEKVDAISARADAQSQRDEATIARATLEDRIAFATIDLALYQSPQVRRTERMDVDAVVRRDGPGFFARLGHALRVGWHGSLEVVIALSRLWMLWLVVLAAVLVVRARRRLRKS